MNAGPWPESAHDTELPNPARMHDALLGGCYNFGVDRGLATQLAAAAPSFALGMIAERRFMHRAIRFCADAGIRQFLDLGCGIPGVGNAYHVVQHTVADASIVCVDVDPVAIALTLDVVKGNERATAICADVRRPGDILNHSTVMALLNFEEPVAVLLVSVLHHLGDQDDPCAVTAHVVDRMVAGSTLVISHLSGDNQAGEMGRIRELTEPTGLNVTPRSRRQILRPFRGVDLVHPGLIWAPHWRPDQTDDADPALAAPSSVLAGVGYKR